MSMFWPSIWSGSPKGGRRLLTEDETWELYDNARKKRLDKAKDK